jgi:hypothetical protein
VDQDTVTRRRVRNPHADSGASLILALAFIVMIGSISAGLIGLATSGLNNRDSLEQVRNREYAADGAIEQAVSAIRLQVGPALTKCALANGSMRFPQDGSGIWVDWRNDCEAVRTTDGLVVAQRNVVLSACNDVGSSCLDAAVIIRAQVNFQQVAGVVTKTYVQSWSVNR